MDSGGYYVQTNRHKIDPWVGEGFLRFKLLDLADDKRIEYVDVCSANWGFKVAFSLDYYVTIDSQSSILSGRELLRLIARSDGPVSFIATEHVDTINISETEGHYE